MVATTKGLPGMDDVSTAIEVSIKGDRSRDEMTINDPLIGSKTFIHITRLDKGLRWTVDTQHMCYSETAFSRMPAPAQEEAVTDTSIRVVVERPGKTKEILNNTCEEVIVSVHSVGDTLPLVSQQMWVSRDFEGYAEIDSFFKLLMASGIAAPLSPNMVGEAGYMLEFQDTVQSIDGFPLEATMFMLLGSEDAGYVIEIHSIVTKLAIDALEDSLFEIPKGYTLCE
jgi:hypothetical protein